MVLRAQGLLLTPAPQDDRPAARAGVGVGTGTGVGGGTGAGGGVGMEVGIGSRRCAVLGHPVGHSLSPVLHRAAYAWLGLDWTYEARDVTADGLAAFLDRISPDSPSADGLVTGAGGSWRGLSLTMPLKRAVLPLLDSVDPLAVTVGAANTVVLGPAGRHGSNTDVGGLLDALAEAGIGAGGRAPGSCLVLGGGATAASTVAALARLGPAEVVLAVRDPARAAEVLGLGRRVGLPVRTAALDTPARWRRPDLVVSTLPAGAADAVAEAVAGVLAPDALVFDVVYDGWPTPVARAAARAGAGVLSGLDLLVHQAAGQVLAFTGRAVPVAVLRAALGSRPGAAAPGPAPAPAH